MAQKSINVSIRDALEGDREAARKVTPSRLRGVREEYAAIILGGLPKEYCGVA